MIQKIHEAQLISIVQLETSSTVRRANSAQTIVVLDPSMLVPPTPQGATPPPYASLVPADQSSERCGGT
ncbi:unnamed protein product [Mesocestoides corti]|nr:unnamed protein product [Mesocestoides corti]